jgi:acyl-coenzyme A thioesterase PaaI-like protein
MPAKPERSQWFRWWHLPCSLPSQRPSTRKPIMTSSTQFRQARLKTVRTQSHPYCIVCSQSNPLGFGLAFTVHDDGSVSASVHGHVALEGFQGCLHGGMIASLLDGAMTNCLFAHGHVAMTAELRVRYRKPVLIGPEMTIRAWITRSQPPLHLLEAELQQEGCAKAIASAEFFEINEEPNRSHHPGRE